MYHFCKYLQKVLPSSDRKHVSETVCLLVDMYRYKQKHASRIALGDPPPGKPVKEIPMPKNIVAEALKVRDFLAADPKLGYRHAAIEFGITKARISQLLKILKALPPEFIAYMAKCQEREKLKEFSGKKMLKMAKMDAQTQQAAIAQ